MGSSHRGSKCGYKLLFCFKWQYQVFMDLGTWYLFVRPGPLAVGTMPGPSFRGCNYSVVMGSGPTRFRFCHERSCDLFHCCSSMKKACTQSNTRYIKCNCGAMLREKQSPEHSSIHTLTLSDTLTLTYCHQ